MHIFTHSNSDHSQCSSDMKLVACYVRVGTCTRLCTRTLTLFSICDEGKQKNSYKIRPAYLFCDDRVLFFCRKKCVMHFTSGSIQDTFSFCLERKDKRAVLQRLKLVFHLPIFPVFSVLGRITQEGRSKSQYLTDRLNKNDLENN